MTRSDEEIAELQKLFEDTLDVISKDPVKLVKLTGGSVPPVVSQIQVLWTSDVANFGINILKWTRGEENGVLSVGKTMLEKLKNAE